MKTLRLTLQCEIEGQILTRKERQDSLISQSGFALISQKQTILLKLLRHVLFKYCSIWEEPVRM